MAEVTRSDATEKEKKLIELVLDYKDRFEKRRWVFEREWYRNVLFYLGQQWITYEESFRRWRTRNLPRWVPLPVTNRLASTANVIRSAVAQVHPAFTAFPTRESEKSILSANAADKYLDVIMQESGFRGARRRMASWITLTGNGFLHTEFDTSDDTGKVLIPGEACLDCGQQMRPSEIPTDLKCPRCGSENLKEEPALGEEVPQGRLRVRALSPFEVYLDNHISELDDQTAILVIEARALEAVKQTYGKEADDVVPDGEREHASFYLESLAHMTSTGVGAGMRAGDSSGKGGAVTLYRLYVKTCKDYPDGLYVVMSGDQHILETHDPYPFRYLRTNRPFFPMVHIRYDDVPGRFWAKTPIDDLVFKQRQRNEIESLFQTIVMRMANPVWLLPFGVQTSPITGDPGIAIRFSGAAGQKPERLPGVDAPASVIKFIEQIDQDFEEIANTFAVLKGKNPGSIRAASAIQMLIERGFGRYGSVFDNLEESYEQWAIQALEIWRQNTVFPRVQVVAQAAGSWQFQEFMGADLGEIDIRVEAGSTRPKSQAGRQMLIGQALQWGLLNVNDPEQRMKIFEEMGMLSLLPGAEMDTKVVAEENAQFMAWAQSAMEALKDESINPQQGFEALLKTFPIHIHMYFDHHPTHLVHHRRLALSEQFRALPEALQQLFAELHMKPHMLLAAQEQATGLGVTSIAAVAAAGAQGGVPGQSTPSGQPKTGKGPGGAETPFGGKDTTGGSDRAGSSVTS